MDSDENTEQGCYTEHGVSGYGVAAKLTAKEALDSVFIKAMAEEMMLSIAEKCMDSGARCIGHIKCHIKTEAGTIKADTIGVVHGSYSTGTLNHPVKEFFIAINSIIQGIKEDVVKGATLDGLHEVTETKNVTVEKEKEHSYFDEFDFVASKQAFVEELEKQLSGDK